MWKYPSFLVASIEDVSSGIFVGDEIFEEESHPEHINKGINKYNIFRFFIINTIKATNEGGHKLFIKNYFSSFFLNATNATPANASPEMIALVAIIEPLQPFFSSVLPGSSSPGSPPGFSPGFEELFTVIS